jgi:hypothetical protein
MINCLVDTAKDTLLLLFQLLEFLSNEHVYNYVMVLRCIWKRWDKNLWNNVEAGDN